MALTTDTRFYYYLFSYPAVAIRYTLALHLNKPGRFPYATLLCNISFYILLNYNFFNYILLYGCCISYNFEFQYG